MEQPQPQILTWKREHIRFRNRCENCQLVETVTISEPNAIDITVMLIMKSVVLGIVMELYQPVSQVVRHLIIISGLQGPTSSISGLSAGVYT